MRLFHSTPDLLVPVLCALALTSCASEQVPPASSEGVATAEKPKEPKTPEPLSGGFDWVRLTSGEWLQGEIVQLRHGTLEFESDKLETLKLDLDDIAEIHSPHANICGFEERVTITGPLTIQGDKVIVGTGENAREYQRSQLMSVVAGEDKELNYWSGKVSLGLSARSGNTNQVDVTASVDVERSTAFTRIALHYNGAFGRLEGEENTNNHRASGKYDVFLTDDLFLTPITAEYYRDPFQNIAHRVTPGAGAGYKLFDLDWFTWELWAGGGYRYTSYVDVPAGEDGADSSGVALGGLKIELEITDDVDFDINYSVDMGVPNTKDTNHHAQAVVSVELTSILDLDVGLTWDHVGDPRPDDTGAVPKKDDLRLTVGLGFEF